MFTRCPGCQSVYRLEATTLVEAAGVVRCSQCGRTFNALSHLFDQHPAGDQAPLSGTGIPPLLDQATVEQVELPWATSEVERPSGPAPLLDFAEPGPEQSETGTHWAWRAAALVLTLALGAQIVVHWQTPGSPIQRLVNGEQGSGTDASARVQVISRDMHRHPSLDDAIIVSATLRNPTDDQLDWPTLEVHLYDPSQQVLGARRLQPEEYLGDADTVDRGMAPDVMVPVVLEFVVGTTDPTGFELRFPN